MSQSLNFHLPVVSIVSDVRVPSIRPSPVVSPPSSSSPVISSPVEAFRPPSSISKGLVNGRLCPPVGPKASSPSIRGRVVKEKAGFHSPALVEDTEVAADFFGQLWSVPSPPRHRPLLSIQNPSRQPPSSGQLVWIRKEIFATCCFTAADCFPVPRRGRFDPIPKQFHISREGLDWGVCRSPTLGGNTRVLRLELLASVLLRRRSMAFRVRPCLISNRLFARRSRIKLLHRCRHNKLLPLLPLHPRLSQNNLLIPCIKTWSASTVGGQGTMLEIVLSHKNISSVVLLGIMLTIV